MRTTFIRLAIAIVFAVVAWLSWSEAKFADRIGDARQQIVTLRYSDVAADLAGGTTLSDYLPQQRRLSEEARLAKSTVAYWLGRYEDVSADVDDEDVDAEALLIVANAAFRDAQREIPGTGIRPFDKLRAAPSGVEGREPGAVVQRLDGVLNAYSSALKASPRSVEAAYNYEFVARYRDQLARSHGKGSKPRSVPAAATMAGDLPAGPTIHGRPGGPPPEAKMEELQMLAPMEYGDREAQPEATPGGKRERKG
jgi:hypothetical protein